MHMAGPIVCSGTYYAAIGYLSRSRQLSLAEIVAQIVAGVNCLSEWCHQNGIGLVRPIYTELYHLR